MGLWNKLSRALSFNPDKGSNNTFEFSDLFSATGLYNAAFNWGNSDTSSSDSNDTQEVGRSASDILSGLLDSLGFKSDSSSKGEQEKFLEDLRALQKESAAEQMEYQTQSAERAMQFSHDEAQLNRDWQQMMSNTAYQRSVSDMKKAGINPILAAGGSSFAATTPSGASASGIAQSGAQAEVGAENYSMQYLQTLLSGYGSIFNSASSIHNTSTSAKVQMFSSMMNALSGLVGKFLPTKIQKVN